LRYVPDKHPSSFRQPHPRNSGSCAKQFWHERKLLTDGEILPSYPSYLHAFPQVALAREHGPSGGGTYCICVPLFLHAPVTFAPLCSPSALFPPKFQSPSNRHPQSTFPPVCLHYSQSRAEQAWHERNFLTCAVGPEALLLVGICPIGPSTQPLPPEMGYAMARTSFISPSFHRPHESCARRLWTEQVWRGWGAKRLAHSPRRHPSRLFLRATIIFRTLETRRSRDRMALMIESSRGMPASKRGTLMTTMAAPARGLGQTHKPP
jgi:hypothetical protein